MRTAWVGRLRMATIHIGEDSTYAVGGTVVIYCDPSNPAHARTPAERNWPHSTWVAFALLCMGLIAPVPGVVIAVRGKRELRSFQGPSRPALIEHWVTRLLNRPRVAILNQELQPVGLMVPTQPVGMLRGGWLPRFTRLAVVGQRAEALVSWDFREASPNGWPRHGARVTILIPGPPQVISGRLIRHGRRYDRLRQQQGQEGLIHAVPGEESLAR
jgi:hypothetical protein